MAKTAERAKNRRMRVQATVFEVKYDSGTLDIKETEKRQNIISKHRSGRCPLHIGETILNL